MISEFQKNTGKQLNELRKIMLYLNKKIEILRKTNLGNENLIKSDKNSGKIYTNRIGQPEQRISELEENSDLPQHSDSNKDKN
jgi:hypothetical protein